MKRIKHLLILVLLSLLLSACKDSSVEPETPFVQIYFKYNFKNELNTFENTFQKDLVFDGVIKVKFWLTEEEQNKILEKANLVNFFSMPDTFIHSSSDSILVSINPDPGEQVLRIKYQSYDKTTLWNYPPLQNNEQFNDLIKLQQYIVSIIESKPEYKKLPPARGGYD
ncbi:MAG: hypothetical protein STSR0008_18650 [Ignavibacterium sp.]